LPAELYLEDLNEIVGGGAWANSPPNTESDNTTEWTLEDEIDLGRWKQEEIHVLERKWINYKETEDGK